MIEYKEHHYNHWAVLRCFGW